MDRAYYIAELDADVDDVIAAEYLKRRNALAGVVLSPKPKTSLGWDRCSSLKKMGIDVFTKIPDDAKYVFVGGALTSVAEHIANGHSIECLVMNGGFVGSNIVPQEFQLDKFRNKLAVRTFNFNIDIDATVAVLKAPENSIKRIVLVGKNVCHSERNTEKDLWNDKNSLALFRKYHVRDGKRQHDMLACHEGLALLGLGGVDDTFCEYQDVYPFNQGLEGSMTRWGSGLEKTEYRKVYAATSLPE